MKSWSEEDIKNPLFFVGQVFPSIVELRKVEYSLKKKVEIKLPKNGNRRLRGHN